MPTRDDDPLISATGAGALPKPAEIEALRLLHEVTRGANEAATPEEAMEIALRAVCRWTGWEVGHAWRLPEDEGGGVVCADVWYAADGCDIDTLVRSSARMRIAPGEGFVGSILASKRPLQAVDLSGVDDPRVAVLESLGFRAVLGMPVVADGHAVAALEFFRRDPAEVSPFVEEVLTDIGVQVGHAKHRRRLERLVANQSEQERHHLARELHDTLGQQIVALGMMAANLTRGLRQDGSDRAVAAARLVEGLDVAKQQTRALTKGLLPVEVDSTGLEIALRDLVEAIQAGFPDVRFHVETSSEVGVENNFIATHLYRIAQEALYNANSHASPRNVTLFLRRAGDDRVELEVRDDGKGLPDPLPHGAGSGLRIMRHRAGLIGARLTIASVPGGGTTVKVRAPRGGLREGSPVPDAD